VLRYALKRCLWMLPMLLGITLVAFLLMDLAPVDRAQLDLLRAQPDITWQERQSREVALLRLRIRYGLVDPATGEPLPVWSRYGHWLVRAASFRLAGPDEDQAEFRARIGSALPVSLLLGFWALVITAAVGVPLGIWLGLHAGSRGERAASGALFTLLGMPEFMLATLLVLLFGGAGLGLLPTSGLHSDDAVQRSLPASVLDVAWHLVLPVGVLATGPVVMVARFLRESIVRTAAQPFAWNLRAWGIGRRIEVMRLLRNALSPLATLVGNLLPMLVTGSVVVETVFSLEGVGRLAYSSVLGQDQAMVMTLTLLGAVATLLALFVSDLMHRAVDPRVRLQR
jgi:ABC-type dipeptide/oligopeptide/nickel transport system permease component